MRPGLFHTVLKRIHSYEWNLGPSIKLGCPKSFQEYRLIILYVHSDSPGKSHKKGENLSYGKTIHLVQDADS